MRNTEKKGKKLKMVKTKIFKNYSCNLIVEIEKVFYNNEFASEL
jgi:hypothetical protein